MIHNMGKICWLCGSERADYREIGNASCKIGFVEASIELSAKGKYRICRTIIETGLQSIVKIAKSRNTYASEIIRKVKIFGIEWNIEQ